MRLGEASAAALLLLRAAAASGLADNERASHFFIDFCQ
jgi:hypothetical protein